jgi:hypothetical protein
VGAGNIIVILPAWNMFGDSVVDIPFVKTWIYQWISSTEHTSIPDYHGIPQLMYQSLTTFVE